MTLRTPEDSVEDELLDRIGVDDAALEHTVAELRSEGCVAERLRAAAAAELLLVFERLAPRFAVTATIDDLREAMIGVLKSGGPPGAADEWV